ncbi:hypothetical protein DM867_09370 [Halosegnis rubeus]|uniref:Uncharacterized protein n=1 Tax=Halosegnis rubeus TaxID=2212850 RepID=A0A5N5U610_9EURY|nr:hypothetical protein DM867_09370 [Halosegnis rubeus]KAB7514381.1 hypothetical protein DMP03_11005 [Halosegnis rubeus]KAB7518704.1 hypothetical protein DP108_05905 [Halosegnis rubeus]
MSDQAGSAAPSSPRRRVAVVVAIIFIDLLGFGIIIPVLPFYPGRCGERLRYHHITLPAHLRHERAMDGPDGVGHRCCVRHGKG